MDLNLGRQVLFHLFLDPSQHEGSQDLMQLVHDLAVLALLLFISEIPSSLATKVEPLIEFLA